MEGAIFVPDLVSGFARRVRHTISIRIYSMKKLTIGIIAHVDAGKTTRFYIRAA